MPYLCRTESSSAVKSPRPCASLYVCAVISICSHAFSLLVSLPLSLCCSPQPTLAKIICSRALLPSEQEHCTLSRVRIVVLHLLIEYTRWLLGCSFLMPRRVREAKGGGRVEESGTVVVKNIPRSSGTQWMLQGC